MSLLTTIPFRWLKADGTPAAGYVLRFFEAGTANPKTIYTDPGLTTPFPSPSNQAVLNSQGFALVYLGIGGYKMQVLDQSLTVVYTQDNIIGEGSFGTGFVNSFEDLKNVDPNLNHFTYIAGYASPGDGGHGMFYVEASSVPADGGYVQDSNVDPTKKWFRIPDENGDVRAASFGYLPDVGTIQTSQLIAADAYAASMGARLRIKSGIAAQIGAMTFTAPRVVFEGTGIKGVLTVPSVNFEGIVEGPLTRLFTRMNVLFSGKQISYPEWFGADTANSAGDNDAPLAAWADAGGSLVLPAGTWNITDAKAFLEGLPCVFTAYGVLNGNTYAFGPGLWVPTTVRAQSILFHNDRFLEDSGSDKITADRDFGAVRDLTAGRDASTVRDLTVGRHAGITNNLNVGGDAAITGGLDVTQNIHGLNNVSAQYEVNAGTNVTAGSSVEAGTFVKAKAGASAASFTASGLVFSGSSSDIQSAPITFPYKGGMAGAGACVKIEAFGSFTGGGDRTISITNSGGVSLVVDRDGAGVTPATKWWLTAFVIPNGTIFAELRTDTAGNGSPGGTVAQPICYDTGSINPANDASLIITTDSANRVTDVFVFVTAYAAAP
jgi:hypothetical protein